MFIFEQLQTNMALPFEVYQRGKNCSHKFPNIENAFVRKLGKKRCGDFEDSGIYQNYRNTPIPSDGTELHIPGYNFCGPGTQVDERILRGDYGINKLDNACREHDVDYMFHADDKAALMEADQKLAGVAELYEQELISKQKSNSALGSFLNFVGFGSFFPSAIKIGLGLPNEYHRLAAKGVKDVFRGKGFIEGIGIMDPVNFAKRLTKDGTTQEDVLISGKNLMRYV